MKKIKICFVIPEFSYAGGIERVLSKWSTNLPVEVEHVIVTLFQNDNTYLIKKQIDWKNKAEKIINLNFKWNGNLIIKYLKLKNMGKNIDQVASEYNCDIIVSCGYIANDVVMKTKSIYKRILSLHVKEKATIKRKLQYRKFKNADKVISVSDELAQLFSKDFNIDRNKICVIQNAVDDNVKINYTIKNKMINNKFNIVTVGRLEEQKNHRCMIKAMKKVVEFDKNIVLNIFGDGSLKTEYQNLISKYRLQDNVILHGVVLNVVEHMKNGNLFLLTSKYEGFATVLLEASQANLPILSTYCQTGVLEYLNPSDKYVEPQNIINGKYGIILPSYNNKNIINLLSSQIINLSKDKYLLKKYKELSSKRVEAFNISKSIEELIRVFNS